MMKPMMMMKRTQKTPREAPIAVPMTTLEMKETKGQRVSQFHCVSGSVHGMDKGCGGWDKTNLGPEVFE